MKQTCLTLALAFISVMLSGVVAAQDREADWMNNNLGEQQAVLPPWTPVEVVNNGANNVSVKCWGREYRFDNSSFPSQIISGGKALLASPINLSVAESGRTVAWSKATVSVTASSPASADITTRATAGTGSLIQTVIFHIEYDGLMTISMQYTGAGDISEAVLDIPLAGEVAKYEHRWQPTFYSKNGLIPKVGSPVEYSKFIPYAWVGDMERGLFWFCESPAGWPNWQAENVFELMRPQPGGTVTMRFNLIKNSITAGGNTWKLQMGLQATPVKEMPADWRKWRLAPAANATVNIVWPTGADNSLKYFGYPEAKNPALFSKQIESIRKQNQLAVPYSCLTYLSSQADVWRKYAGSWSAGWADKRSAGIAGTSASFERINPTVKTYRDFIIWKNTQFFKQYGLGGFYQDLSKVYDMNLRKTKNNLPYYPILSYRDMYRRVYAEVKSSGKPTFMIAHSSGNVNIPVLAYEDAYLDGEQFRTAPLKVKDAYTDVISLEQFRSEFIGRQWGIMPFFLPEFDTIYSKQAAPTRGLIGLLLLHDVSAWPKWSNLTEWNKAYNSLDKFGYVNAHFLAYFDASPPATVNAQNVYMSVYKRSDGKSLAVLVNTGKNDRTGTFRLNTNTIGISSPHIYSWPDQQQITAVNGNVSFKISGLDYQMYLISAD